MVTIAYEDKLEWPDLRCTCAFSKDNPGQPDPSTDALTGVAAGFSVSVTIQSDGTSQPTDSGLIQLDFRRRDPDLQHGVQNAAADRIEVMITMAAPIFDASTLSCNFGAFLPNQRAVPAPIAVTVTSNEPAFSRLGYTLGRNEGNLEVTELAYYGHTKINVAHWMPVPGQNPIELLLTSGRVEELEMHRRYSTALLMAIFLVMCKMVIELYEKSFHEAHVPWVLPAAIVVAFGVVEAVLLILH